MKKVNSKLIVPCTSEYELAGLQLVYKPSVLPLSQTLGLYITVNPAGTASTGHVQASAADITHEHAIVGRKSARQVDGLLFAVPFARDTCPDGIEQPKALVVTGSYLS